MFLDWPLLTWAIALLVIGVTIGAGRLMLRPRVELLAQEARSSEKEWDEFCEGLVGYLEIDHHGIVQHVNRTTCELVGLPAHDVLGKHYVDLEPVSVYEFPAPLL